MQQIYFSFSIEKSEFGNDVLVMDVIRDDGKSVRFFGKDALNKVLSADQLFSKDIVKYVKAIKKLTDKTYKAKKFAK